MRKVTFLVWVALLCFACNDEDDPTSNQRIEGRTVFAFFWADNTLTSELRENIVSMMSGLQTLDKPATLLVYWDGSSSDANWSTPSLIKYTTDGEGGINGYAASYVSQLLAGSSATNIVALGTVEKVYPDQNSTDKAVMQMVLGDMISCCPAPSYGIIFGSHGSGWLPTISGTATLSIGQDGGRYSSDTAVIPELAEALCAVNPQKFDFVLFDACMMSCAEVFYELRNATRYCIASVLDIPAGGFPYATVLPYLYATDIRDSLIPVCESYLNYYSRNAWGTVAAVDCSGMEDLAAATREVIVTNQDALPEVDTDALQEYGRASTNFKGYAYDMVQFIQTLAGGETPAAFQTSFDATVLYAGYTQEISPSASLYQIDGDNYCGVGMYIPNALTTAKYTLWNDYFKSSIAWYEAAGWAETEAVWEI